MKKYSIWLEQMKSEEPVLTNDITCDVLIIGAGMTGVSTAYHLKDKNVVVVDRNKVGHGISARTTGKITYLQDIIFSDILVHSKADVAKTYIHSQIDAMNLTVDIIKKNQIDCDLQKVSSYLFSENNLEKESAFLKENNIVFKMVHENGKHAIEVKDTYVFHPVKYILSLKEICKKSGVQFYEHTNILFVKKEKDGYICGNEHVSIKAKKVIFACHYPYFLFPYLMPLKCTIEKSYLSASTIKKEKTYSAIGLEKPIISIRYHHVGKKSYLIYLKGSHTFTEYDLEDYFQSLQQDVQPEYLWSNHDIMTFDKMPLVGEIKSNLFLATGYNTWGMGNSNLAGFMIASMIKGEKTLYGDLFSPQRKFQLLALPNIIYSGIKPMIDTKLWKSKQINTDEVHFEKKNGKKVAIYVDNSGKEHIVYPICPHLKCGLIFNSVEKTWDCPCHGSRFDLDGNVLTGPSNYNITYHE